MSSSSDYQQYHTPPGIPTNNLDGGVEFPHYGPYHGQSSGPAPYYTEDQEYYEPQGYAAGGRSYSYPGEPDPVHSFPGNENIEAYPLNQYQPPPPPPNHQHALRMDNYYDDDYVDSADEADDFKPFPISGDQYPLNTFDDESEETSYSPDNEQPQPIPIIGTPSMPQPPPQPQSTQMPLEEPPMPPPPFAEEEIIQPPEEGMQPRRVKTMRRVRLYRGNLVLDCPVSKRLISQLNEKLERELIYMRYSAATCDPSMFLQNEFTLRQTCYRQPRETEIFICVTLYNEDDILLGRTLQGIFRNIKHLVNRTRSRTWGKESWRRIVVCVVADGRDKINPRALALLAALGVYQEGFAKNVVNDKAVVAHIYEYTTKVGISHIDKTVKLTTEKTIPVQMVFCLKEHNQRKINSHRWFFQAFSPILRPNICMLLDAGTQPSHDSIYHLWKSFDMHPDVGGACGEIEAGLGVGWRKLFNPLVAAQNFEYKMSNILDKPLESVFGFITVLPGAFSAYRYNAVQNDFNGVGPLEKYFKGETLHERGAGIFTANMYLAEDRILCFELVAKRHESWLLKYVKSAKAETDVPDHLSELVLQRRRWLNGSFFATIYAQTHIFSIWSSGHSLLRKLALHVEFFYQFVSMLFSWFAIGNFFLVFRILTNSLGDPSLGFAPGKVLSVILLYVYCGCIITIFVLSFGNRPNGTHIFYILMAGFFAMLMAYLIFATIYISVKSVQYALCINHGFKISLVLSNELFRDLVISLLSTYALYFVSSFLAFEPWHMFTSFLQYLLLSPAYINVLNVYAFCNLHDISWGTKGDLELRTDLGVAKTDTGTGHLEVDVPTGFNEIDNLYMNQIVVLSEPAAVVKTVPSKYDLQQDYYALFRSSVVLIWIFTNIALIAVVLNVAGGQVVTTGDGSTSTSQAFTKLSGLTKRQHDTSSCGSLGSTGGIGSQIYLSVVLWAMAGLSGFRFLGTCSYLIARVFGR